MAKSKTMENILLYATKQSQTFLPTVTTDRRRLNATGRALDKLKLICIEKFCRDFCQRVALFVVRSNMRVPVQSSSCTTTSTTGDDDRVSAFVRRRWSVNEQQKRIGPTDDERTTFNQTKNLPTSSAYFARWRYKTPREERRNHRRAGDEFLTTSNTKTKQKKITYGTQKPNNFWYRPKNNDPKTKKHGI